MRQKMKYPLTILSGILCSAYVGATDMQNNVEVVVKDTIEAPLSSTQILTSEEIKQRPTGDGNVTDLLKTNPAVQFSNSANNAMTQGEIKPADISIHGSTAYQNSFTLDGMNINNDIDPASGQLGVTNSQLSSDEQGFYLDSKLIESVTVYDANVPVEFGGFTGGVVEVKSRRWQGETSAHVYYRTTDASWNNLFVDEKLDFSSKNNDASRPARFQPKYSKNSYGVSFETGITDNLGMIVSLSRRSSSIPMQRVGGKSVNLNGDTFYEFEMQDSMQTQTRTADNIFSKLTWYVSPKTTADLSVTYSGYDAELFMNGIAKSNYSDKHDGLSTTLQVQHMFDFATLDVSAGFQSMQDKRTSEQNNFVSLVDYSDWKNPTSYSSGGPGDLLSKQQNSSLKAKISFNPVKLAGVTHQVVTGAEMTHSNAKSSRKKTYFRNSYNAYMPTPSVDAFFAGEKKTNYTNIAAFIEDTLKLGDVTVRAGLRIDRDDFIKRTNIAPRVSSSWDVFSDNSTTLSAGASRYYGRSMLTYALYEAQNAGLKHCMMNCTPNSESANVWTNTPDYEGMGELQTPYNDELTLGVAQVINNSLWSLNYVHRLGRDEVRARYKYPDANKYSAEAKIRSFDNQGKTYHDSVALTVANRVPFEIAQSLNQMSASVVWQKTTSNSPSNQGYAFHDPSMSLDRTKVWYDGKIIDADDLPSTDFNAPWRVNLEWTSQLPTYDLTFYNLLQWQSSREQVTRHENEYAIDSATGNQVMKYEAVDFEDTLRWDVKAQWQPKFAYGASLALEVTNLLNNKNASDAFVSGGNVYRSYEAGRQFWLQVSFDY